MGLTDNRVTRQRVAEFGRTGRASAKDEHLGPRAQHPPCRKALLRIEKLARERLTSTVRHKHYEVTVRRPLLSCVEHFAQAHGPDSAHKALTGEDLGFYRHLDRPLAPATASLRRDKRLR